MSLFKTNSKVLTFFLLGPFLAGICAAILGPLIEKILGQDMGFGVFLVLFFIILISFSFFLLRKEGKRSL